MNIPRWLKNYLLIVLLIAIFPAACWYGDSRREKQMNRVHAECKQKGGTFFKRERLYRTHLNFCFNDDGPVFIRRGN